MAPFVSGGLTLESLIPCQLAPTTGAPGMDGRRTAGPALAGLPETAWLFRWAKPFTPVRPKGRPEWPDAAPAATGPTSPAASAAPARVNNRRFFLTEPPSGQDHPDHRRFGRTSGLLAIQQRLFREAPLASFPAYGRMASWFQVPFVWSESTCSWVTQTSPWARVSRAELGSEVAPG